MKKYWAAIFAGCVLSAVPVMAEMSAGAAKIKITPSVETFQDTNGNNKWEEGEPFDDLNHNGAWDPVWLAGYRAGRFAEGVQDDLWVRAFFVNVEDRSVLFISIDLIGYMFDEVEQAKREISDISPIKILPENIFISATHTHSGPDSIGIWGESGEKSGKNILYMNFVREKVLQCALDAVNSMRPVRLKFGKTKLAKPIEDSRPPAVINDLLLSISAVDNENKTVATMVNYAVHAEVMDESNRMITADFPGYMRDSIESRLGGTALFFPADIGGMQTPRVGRRNFKTCKKYGEAIADEVIKSLSKSEPIATETLTVTPLKLLSEIENQRFLGGMQKGLFGDTSQALVRDSDKTYIPSAMAVITLGPAWMATVPGELFPELGQPLRVMLNSDYPFLLGLCNNEIGYILPKADWNPKAYEESMSLGSDTGRIFMKTYTDLLTQ